MDGVVESLISAWERFDVPLRMRHGFDEAVFVLLKDALRQCAESWASRDEIPRAGVNILIDIFPATEGNSALYDEVGAARVMDAVFELQELVMQCVAINE